jgi:hypothetical protein
VEAMEVDSDKEETQVISGKTTTLVEQGKKKA